MANYAHMTDISERYAVFSRICKIKVTHVEIGILPNKYVTRKNNP